MRLKIVFGWCLLLFLSSSALAAIDSEFKASIEQLLEDLKYEEVIPLLEEKIYVENPDSAALNYLSLKLMKAYTAVLDAENLMVLSNRIIDWKKDEVDIVLNQALCHKAVAYHLLNEFDAALEIAEKCLQSCRAMDDFATESHILIMKILIHCQILYSQVDPVLFNTMANDLRQNLERVQILVADKLMAQSMMKSSLFLNMAIAYENLGEYKKGRDLFKKGLRVELQKEKPDLESVCLLYNNIAASYNEDAMYEKAILYQDSLSLYYHEGLSLRVKRYFTSNAYWTYSSIKNFPKAEFYLDSIAHLNNLVLKERAEKKLKESTILLEKEKQAITKQKANENKKIYFQNLLLGMITLGVLGSFAAIYFLLKNEKKKHKLAKAKILSEKKLFATQLNSSFIDSNISMTQQLLRQNKHKDSAKHLLTFANYIRAILENSSKRLVKIEREVAAIENYAALNQANIKFELQQQIDAFDYQDLLVPPMILQSFVELFVLRNIEHDGQSNLILSLDLQSDTIHVVLTDLVQNKLKNTTEIIEKLAEEVNRLAEIDIRNELEINDVSIEIKLLMPTIFSE